MELPVIRTAGEPALPEARILHFTEDTWRSLGALLRGHLPLNPKHTHTHTPQPLGSQTYASRSKYWEFPGPPVVRTPRLHCRGCGFNPFPHLGLLKTKDQSLQGPLSDTLPKVSSAPIQSLYTHPELQGLPSGRGTLRTALNRLERKLEKERSFF